MQRAQHDQVQCSLEEFDTLAFTWHASEGVMGGRECQLPTSNLQPPTSNFQLPTALRDGLAGRDLLARGCGPDQRGDHRGELFQFASQAAVASFLGGAE